MFFQNKQLFFNFLIFLIIIPVFHLTAVDSGSLLFEKGKTYYSNGKYLHYFMMLAIH